MSSFISLKRGVLSVFSFTLQKGIIVMRVSRLKDLTIFIEIHETGGGGGGGGVGV